MNSLPLKLALSALPCAPPHFSGPHPPPKSIHTAVARELDTILANDWAKNKLQPNPLASDEVFVHRRIYLDSVGRIPSCRETEEFLDTKDPNKRAALIDKLLAEAVSGYQQHFFNYWADVSSASSGFRRDWHCRGGPPTRFLYQGQPAHEQTLRSGSLRELVSSKGKPWENGAIGYYMRDNKMPLDNFANTARIFLGTRIECAQCHNHPFDKWTQMQFYQMTAFTYANEVRAYTNPAITGMQALNAQERVELARRFPESAVKGSPQLAAQHEAELEHMKFVQIRA